MNEPVCIWPVGAELGEGPMWLHREMQLKFVDILKGQVLTFDPAANLGTIQHVGAAPSFIVPARNQRLLVGAGSAIRELDDTGLGPIVAKVPHPDHNRTNDATVDGSGALWFGAMDSAELRQTGGVWRLDRHGLRDTGLRAVVTNGPAVTADGSYLYHVDSLAGVIWRCRIVADGQLIDHAPFIHVDSADGIPDGVVLDAEDCLWVALWDGWAVRRYAPTGDLMAHVRLPCARVTKLAFGGADFRTAYVTTARVGLSGTTLERQPLAGGLFAFETETPGLPLPEADVFREPT